MMAPRRAAAAHDEHEKRIGQKGANWPQTGMPHTWWRRQAGQSCRSNGPGLGLDKQKHIESGWGNYEHRHRAISTT